MTGLICVFVHIGAHHQSHRFSMLDMRHSYQTNKLKQSIAMDVAKPTWLDTRGNEITNAMITLSTFGPTWAHCVSAWKSADLVSSRQAREKLMCRCLSDFSAQLPVWRVLFQPTRAQYGPSPSRVFGIWSYQESKLVHEHFVLFLSGLPLFGSLNKKLTWFMAFEL